MTSKTTMRALLPNRILRTILETPRYSDGYTFVVLGRPGPTGKTWLCTGLREYGFKAVEISEDLGCLVDYRDNKNYIIENHIDRTVVIVLNERLNWKGSVMEGKDE